LLLKEKQKINGIIRYKLGPSAYSGSANSEFSNFCMQKFRPEIFLIFFSQKS